MGDEFITIPQLAEILGVSRISVYKKVRAGKIKAKKAGRIYLIARSSIDNITGKNLTPAVKMSIEQAVKRTVAEYGEVLKMLGDE